MNNVKKMNSFDEGRKKIKWAKQNMPVLRGLEKELDQKKPLKGKKVAVSIHLEAKTAYFCEVLKAAGAEVYMTGSNPLSTQDDVANALSEKGIHVFAWYNASEDEYNSHLKHVLDNNPDIIIDDGGDLINLLHKDYQELLEKVLGGCEETTTGVNRLRSMDKHNDLHIPMILVNEAKCKYLFDNRYGTGQSVISAINSTTNLVLAGKNVVVAGYGWCGRGVAMRAKGLGANVIITEIDPVKSLEAVMDGFGVMSMQEASSLGDVFITVTGCKGVITYDHILNMKNGTILCNAGHFNVEIDMDELEKRAESVENVRKNIDSYTLSNNKCINILAQGRLVNLAAGDGHPVEIMDMSFSVQLLCVLHLLNNKLEKGIHHVPSYIDDEVANRKLKALGIEIDKLTAEQKKYLNL